MTSIFVGLRTFLSYFDSAKNINLNKNNEGSSKEIMIKANMEINSWFISRKQKGITPVLIMLINELYTKYFLNPTSTINGS